MNAVETPTRRPSEPQIWPLSVKAYHTLGELGLIPERTELLYGQVFEKMPKSPLHAALFLRLLELLQKMLPSGFHLRPEQPITCDNSEPEPDMAVVRGRKEEFWEEHPHSAELVVEICVTSHQYDRSKLRAYATAGVKECWLVLVPEKQIEVYRRPITDRFEEVSLHGPGGHVCSVAVPEISVELGALVSK